MNWRDSPDENETKHDRIQNIFTRMLYEIFLTDFQLRIIRNDPSRIAFGLIFHGITTLIY